MAQKLTDRINNLEKEIGRLKSKILDLTKKTEAGRIKPESRVPILDLSRTTPMPSSGTGLGKLSARQGGIIWNDADAQNVPWGQQPSTPTKGYHKHSHSRYAGGALDISTLELVEYDFSGENKHCQAYWNVQPSIKKEDGIEKIGLLDITFDKTSGKWLAGGIIDVEKTKLVQKDEDGNIIKEAIMLGDEDNTKNVVWDENAQCWRFYAVYADEEE